MAEKNSHIEALRKAFEQRVLPAKRRLSRRGFYSDPPTSRDWKWFQLGATAANTAPGTASGPAVTPTVDAETARETLPWRCFHCEEIFTGKKAAREHFGDSEYQQAICTIPAEHFRWMEAQHRRNVDDDSDSLRTIRGLVSTHEDLRRKAEEIGYARGLADAKKHPAELGLMLIQGEAA